jgi:hypothetical protein
MAPVVVALQVVVAVQLLQGVALALAVVYLARRLKAVTEDITWRDRAQVQPIASELNKLGASVRAARAEAATYLEAVFTGVRGMSRNLDATRAALDEVRRQSAPTAQRPPKAA